MIRDFVFSLGVTIALAAAVASALTPAAMADLQIKKQTTTVKLPPMNPPKLKDVRPPKVELTNVVEWPRQAKWDGRLLCNSAPKSRLPKCPNSDVPYSVPERATGNFATIPGLTPIIRDVLRNRRELIDQAIERVAMGNPRISKAKFARQAWATIEKTPEKSGILRAAVLSRIFEIANRPPSRRTEAQNVFLLGFAVYIQQTRMLLARNMLKAFDEWTAQSRFAGCVKGRPCGSAMYSVGQKPPDLRSVAEDVYTYAAGLGSLVTYFSVVGLVGTGTMTMSALPPGAAGLLLPHATLGTSMAGVAASAAGPLAIAAASITITALALDIIIKQDEFREKLLADFNRSLIPPRLDKMARDPAGRREMTQNFMMLTTGKAGFKGDLDPPETANPLQTVSGKTLDRVLKPGKKDDVLVRNMASGKCMRLSPHSPVTPGIRVSLGKCDGADKWRLAAERVFYSGKPFVMAKNNILTSVVPSGGKGEAEQRVQFRKGQIVLMSPRRCLADNRGKLGFVRCKRGDKLQMWVLLK